MAATVVTIEVFGEPEIGVWCPVCLLPSAATAGYIISGDRATLGRGTITFCPDCEWFDGTAPV